jgi:hypothetical protein
VKEEEKKDVAKVSLDQLFKKQESSESVAPALSMAERMALMR